MARVSYALSELRKPGSSKEMESLQPPGHCAQGNPTDDLSGREEWPGRPCCAEQHPLFGVNE